VGWGRRLAGGAEGVGRGPAEERCGDSAHTDGAEGESAGSTRRPCLSFGFDRTTGALHREG
jgi:hypothetical protein